MSRPKKLPIAPFSPHPIFPGGNWQTFAGNVLSKAPRTPESCEEMLITLPDQDQLILDIDHPYEMVCESSPVVLLLHGLSGCSQANYNLHIAHKANNAGYRVVRFNHRGCGKDAIKLARKIYHSGRTEDILCALKAIHKRWPSAPIIIVGFSLSANILLSLLGKNPDIMEAVPGLWGAAAVNPPIDLKSCSDNLGSAKNLLLDRYYTKRLIKSAEERGKVHSNLAPHGFPRRMSLKKFDDLYTVPNSEFTSRDEYYTTCSSKPYIGDIKTPTLILTSEDDPIVPVEMFSDVKLSDQTVLQIEKGGGHMGFIGRTKTEFGDLRWMDAALMLWIEQVLSVRD